MFWFALMPWKLFVFRVASDGPFDTGWLPRDRQIRLMQLRQRLLHRTRQALSYDL